MGRAGAQIVGASLLLAMASCAGPALPPDPPGSSWAAKPLVAMPYPAAPTPDAPPPPREDPFARALELNRGLPRPTKYPDLEIRGFRRTGEYTYADVVMTNRTRHAFVYPGYGRTEPVYYVERWDGRRWIAASPGHCGMGLGAVLLAPSESVSFVVPVNDPGAIRVGASYAIERGREKTVWSPRAESPPEPTRTAETVPIVPAETPGVIPPELVQRVEPVYPLPLANARIEGRVVVKGVVGSDGKTSGIEVTRRSGLAQFDEAAVEALTQWRYKPATLDGHPIAVRVTYEVRFELPAR